MQIISVLFQVALLPEGVKDFHFEEISNENGRTISEMVSDDDVFEEHLCTLEQHSYVLKELKSVYSMYETHVYEISQIEFQGNGLFSCNIINKSSKILKSNDEMNEVVDDLLWPADIHGSAFVFIDGECYEISIEICELSSTFC